MIDFINLDNDGVLEEKLAQIDSSDLVQYIYDLDSDKQEMFLQRLKNIVGDTYLMMIKEAVEYLDEQENN